MEIKTMSDEQKNLMKSVAEHVEQIAGILGLYQPNRYGTNAFTRFEEGMSWINLMIMNEDLKKVSDTKQ